MSSAADVVIVGAGIAGCEAAWLCSSNDLDVVLVTTSLDTVYTLAHDSALITPPEGSLMASVGGTVDGRVRSWDLHRAVKYALEARSNVHLLQSTASTVLVDDAGAAVGIGTWEGVDRLGSHTALCVGSFLRARLTSGAVTETQGRLSEMAYDDLYHWLAGAGFAFVDARFVAEPVGGSLGYTVDTAVLAAAERLTSDSARLARVGRLWAAGACIEGSPSGSGGAGPTYDSAVRDGLALGRELVAAVRRA